MNIRIETMSAHAFTLAVHSLDPVEEVCKQLSVFCEHAQQALCFIVCEYSQQAQWIAALPSARMRVAGVCAFSFNT